MTPLLAASGMTTLLVVVVFFLVFTTLAQRPLKKQAQQQAAMRDSLVEGTRVMLSSGLFGTVTHVGDEQVIIELAPGVEVTATKAAITKVVAPEDEEFEFSEAAPPADVEYALEDTDGASVAHADPTQTPTTDRPAV